jgi:hypothetical protein
MVGVAAAVATARQTRRYWAVVVQGDRGGDGEVRVVGAALAQHGAEVVDGLSRCGQFGGVLWLRVGLCGHTVLLVGWAGYGR